LSVVSPEPQIIRHELSVVSPEPRLALADLDPARRWRNVFTGAVHTLESRDGPPSLAAAALFADFPVALLIAERGD
jgi:hypothetical protein